MTEQTFPLKKRPNWVEFVIDEISFVDVAAVQGAEIVALKRGVTNNSGGDAEMDVRDKTFSDAVRGIVPEKRETIDAELILVRQVVTEALRPLIFQLEELASRIRRVSTSVRAPEDPFGQAVRGGPLTAAEQLAQKRRAERDPFGTAVREVRPTLVVGHRFLRDKRRR